MKEIVIRKVAQYWADTKHPNVSWQRKVAFVNSVVYLTTGYSTGDFGPTIREHLCSWFLVGDGEISEITTDIGNLTVLYPDGRLPYPGKWTIQNALMFCEPICFGNLSKVSLKVVQKEYCFDDDPDDLRQIREWELEEFRSLSAKKKKGKLPQKEFLRWKTLKEKFKK